MTRNDWTLGEVNVAYSEWKGSGQTWPTAMPYLRLARFEPATLGVSSPEQPYSPPNPIELSRERFTEKGQDFVGVFWRGHELERWYA